MAKIVIDASNVSPDVLVWLKQAKDGRYFIERRPNKTGVKSDIFPISIAFAEKLQTMNIRDAWTTMEKHVGIEG